MKLATVAPRKESVRGGNESCCPRNFRDTCPATLKDTRLILVGEAPGENEVKKKEGFVGRSGKLLRKRLHAHGITDYSLTNIVKCRPPGNDKPSSDCIDACMNRTAEEVEGYEVVALIGNTAIEAFFPGQQARKLRGHAVHHPDYPQQRFFCMYHPAWAARGESGGRKRERFDEHVQRLASILRDDGPDFEVVTAEDSRFHDLLEKSLERDRISLDIETNNSLRSWATESRMTSFALTADGHHALFCEEEDPAFPAAQEKVAEWLTDEDHEVIGQHVGFDLEWFERERRKTIQINKVLDVGVLYHHAHGHTMPSLKFLQERHGDGYRHLIPNPGTWEGPQEMALYNAEDVIYPWRLFHRGIKELDRDQLELYLKVCGRSDLYLQRITANGIHFLHDNWRKTKEALEARREEIVDEWREEDPHADVVIKADHEWRAEDRSEVQCLKGSNAFKKYLFEIKGLPVQRETDSGNPSTDKDTLRSLRENEGAEFLEYPLNIRGVEKTLNTYVWGYPDKYVEADGRVHSSYRNTRTDSGRWSSSDPNVQNPSRDDTVPGEASVRSHFGVPEDRIYMSADLSQIEIRVMVCMAEDEEAIQAYREGTDGHLITASRITGKPAEEIMKEERTHAKPVNFALIYRGDKYTVQRQARSYGLEWSLDKCERFVDMFYGDLYPTLKSYHEEVVDRLRANQGEVQDATGMVHRYPKWDHPEDHIREHWERSAINAMGQGPAHFITSRIGILAQQRLRDAGLYPTTKIINTVHDSVEIETREEDADEVMDILEWATQATKPWIEDWFVVPLVLDFEVGPNWSELEELDYSAAA